MKAGFRITSIQRFLEHKKLSNTIIYARAHGQTVADDYFTTMQRGEQSLEIIPAKKDMGIIKVQVVQLIEQPKVPKLCLDERLGIIS